MKLKALLLTAVALIAASPLATAQNAIWGYTALGAAPATDDKLFIYDLSATASKTITVANLFTSPTFTTPTLGVATATSVNGLTITSSTGTLTVTNGKTVSVSNTLTFTGTDSSTVAFGAGGTVIYTTGAQSLASKTLTAPVISTGLTASGSASNDFSGSTGAFLTSSGANTLSGAVTVADATTPSITLASGKTNTGFLLINGKTSGSFKILPADATAQAVVMSIAAQTSGGSTLTIPDLAGVNQDYVFSALAQTLTNKTLTAPVINGASSASGNFDLSGSSGTTKTTTGLTTIGGGVIGSVQALSGAGAVNLTTVSTHWTTTAADAATLADGTAGQIKVVIMKVDGGTGTLTPSTASGFTSITFDDPGDAVTLEFVATIGWVVIGSRGVTF